MSDATGIGAPGAAPERVLLLGSAGLIGGIARAAIAAAGFELSSLDLREERAERHLVADMADLDAILPAFVGQDAVVHLAATLPTASPAGIHRSNLIGARNLFEAARRTGVKRIVFASSNRAVGRYERDLPYRAIVWDTDKAREQIGFIAEDDAENFREAGTRASFPWPEAPEPRQAALGGPLSLS